MSSLLVPPLKMRGELEERRGDVLLAVAMAMVSELKTGTIRKPLGTGNELIDWASRTGGTSTSVREGRRSFIAVRSVVGERHASLFCAHEQGCESLQNMRSSNTQKLAICARLECEFCARQLHQAHDTKSTISDACGHTQSTAYRYQSFQCAAIVTVSTHVMISRTLSRTRPAKQALR